jgi:hypothetical protein
MKKDKSFSPADMPEKEAFEQKEIYQHPQPADSGKPLNKDEKKIKHDTNLKEEDKTSKEAGLNETKSRGDAGAFEGFENQS